MLLFPLVYIMYFFPCSLAVEELLEDGDDDDSLGLGLGEKVYTGVKLSGETKYLVHVHVFAL